jgi:hypothetical protein
MQTHIFEDPLTGCRTTKQESPGTKKRAEVERLFNAKNEAQCQPII